MKIQMTQTLKKGLLFSLLAFSGVQLIAQQQLTIKGELANLQDGKKVYLIDYLKQTMDSTIVSDHKFNFTASLDSSSLYIVQLNLAPKPEDYFYMDMEPGELKIVGKSNNFKDAVFSGSSFVERWKELDDFMLTRCGGGINYAGEMSQKMAQAQAVGDAMALETLQKEFMAYIEKGKPAAKDWVAKYPDEPLSAYVVNAFLLHKIPLDEVKTILKGLGPNGRKSRLAGQMLAMKAQEINTAASPLLNQQAPDFTLTDAAGKTVKLSDFKGKFVLLDFWASWCGPCRREMPFLKAAHEQYKSPDFTILSLSIDTDAAKWRKALEEEKMSWPQLLDDGKQQAGTLYNVQFIPMNFLIDPSGKVLATGLYGDQVSKKLGEVLKK
ncbi:MAG: AhpC/TSA family protein [Sphingobacterium sp.]|jgi:peroxiredoxin|nr:AhpC/TSA family protein [Sphingobacterium sp.]